MPYDTWYTNLTASFFQPSSEVRIAPLFDNRIDGLGARARTSQSGVSTPVPAPRTGGRSDPFYNANDIAGLAVGQRSVEWRRAVPGCVAGKLSANPPADRHRARPLQLAHLLDDESALGDHSARSWFIAIERITAFAQDFGADRPHAHDAPLKPARLARPRSSDQRSGRWKCPAPSADPSRLARD